MVFNGDVHWLDVDPDDFRAISETVLIHHAIAARFPELVGRLGQLPCYLTASVAGRRIGILHGDPESLPGWRLALEAMEPGDPLVRRQVGWHGQPTTTTGLLDWFRRAEVTVFACTHTGLPYAQDLTDHQGRRRLVINNGSAGLANFTGTTFGVITHSRAAPTARRQPLWHQHRRAAR